VKPSVIQLVWKVRHREIQRRFAKPGSYFVEFAEVVEGWLGLAWFGVGVSVSFVEAAGVGVLAVDIDFEQFGAASTGSPLCDRAVPMPRLRCCATTYGSTTTPTGPSYQTLGRKVTGATPTAGSPGQNRGGVGTGQQAPEPVGETARSGSG
jgi:hypothetical protein